MADNNKLTVNNYTHKKMLFTNKLIKYTEEMDVLNLIKKIKDVKNFLILINKISLIIFKQIKNIII